ncbi:MAG: acetate--CoA ligase family protein [Candidatus Korarchaeota archaeon]
MDKNINYLFKPRAIAVIGATNTKGKIGNSIFANIINGGFKGKVYPVNITEDEVLGIKAYKSVLDIPDEVDMVVIAIPAKGVKPVIEQCGKKGVKVAVIITAGYSEIGNVKEERELVELAHSYNMRILGPNIFGVYYAGTSMNATFGPSNVVPGNIAFVTQSGALGIALMGTTVLQRIGLSTIVSIGNKSDIDDADLLEFFENDELTKVIVLYIEALKDAKRFLEVAARVSKKKPIILIKAGRSKRGAAAAASHTGAMAGADAVYSAALKQVGVIRVNTMKEAFNYARIFSEQPPPDGENVVIITNGGGAGVLATDSCEFNELHLFDDLDYLEKVFRQYMPYFGSTKNPVDLTGQANEELYGQSIAAALRSEVIHSIIALYCETSITDPIKIAQEIVRVYNEHGRTKPLVCGFIGGENTYKAISYFNENDVTAFDSPEDAVSALAALHKWRRYSAASNGPIVKHSFNFARIREIIKKAQDEGRKSLLEEEAFEIMKLVGVPIPKHGLARSADEAAKIAKEIGFPVVMKVVSKDIIHKTDVGGLMINIRNVDEAKQAFLKIIENCQKAVPNAKIEGVSVHEMVPIKEGVEVIVGSTTDPTFGPTLLFGFGGIYTEVFKDVAFRIAPVSREEALRMINETTVSKLLQGVRGMPPKDINGVVDVITRIGTLISEVPEIKEMDINPLVVLEKGVYALDPRIIIK